MRNSLFRKIYADCAKYIKKRGLLTEIIGYYNRIKEKNGGAQSGRVKNWSREKRDSDALGLSGS
jgi:hypothetical protein